MALTAAMQYPWLTTTTRNFQIVKLAALPTRLEGIKGKVVICGLRSELHKVFKIMNLEKMLTFADNEQKALNVYEVYTESQ